MNKPKSYFIARLNITIIVSSSGLTTIKTENERTDLASTVPKVDASDISKAIEEQGKDRPERQDVWLLTGKLIHILNHAQGTLKEDQMQIVIPMPD